MVGYLQGRLSLDSNPCSQPASRRRVKSPGLTVACHLVSETCICCFSNLTQAEKQINHRAVWLLATTTLCSLLARSMLVVFLKTYWKKSLTSQFPFHNLQTTTTTTNTKQDPQQANRYLRPATGRVRDAPTEASNGKSFKVRVDKEQLKWSCNTCEQ